jgi:MFS transporter, NNP family, nitrate/nitrite transporter
MPRRVPELIDVQQERIRTLHFTWIAFFISFYLWFNMAPLATTMLRELGGEEGWLTLEHIQLLAICNVALTIPARIVIGALIDRFGPRRCFSGLLIFMSIPTIAFAFGTTFMQLLVARLVLSSVGAGFVIGIRMVAQWFPPKMIGRAEGFYAGWGNFGSAFAAMTLPWLALGLFGAHDDGWRWALALNGVVAAAYGVAYLFLVRDTPKGVEFAGVKKVQPLLVTSWGDLAQYCLWSFPLIGALGLLAWRASKIGLGENGERVISGELFWGILALLGLIYLVHVAKTLQVNVPRLRRGVPKEERYSFHSVAALNTTYFANFGAELAVVSMLPAFFETTFRISPTMAGLVAASFAFVNLVARPLGGLISDTLRNRKLVMLAYMLGITLGFLAMASITGGWPLWLAVVVTMTCSVFVQGAEGATFAILPMINRRMTGQIAGMAGAYGNVGAVVYLVILTLVTPRTFFLILAAGAAVSLAYCAIFLQEPEGSFAEELRPESPATVLEPGREHP